MSSEMDSLIQFIEEKIAEFQKKIAEFQKARDTLIELVDPPDSLRRRLLAAKRVPSSPAELQASGNAPPIVPTPDLLGSGNGNGHDIGKSTRKDEVAKFIRDRGGCASRTDIIAGTGIPKGTVAYVLNDKSRFVGRRGLWRNIEVK